MESEEVETLSGDNFSRKLSWPGERGLLREGNVGLFFLNLRSKEQVKRERSNR